MTRHNRSKPPKLCFWLLATLSLGWLAAVGIELVRAEHYALAADRDWAAETNAAVVARFYAVVWNDGLLTRVDEFVANEHRRHDPDVPDVGAGPAGVARLVAGWRRAFPDLVLTLDEVIARGDRVVVRFTARGTHLGTALGAEGTGRSIEVHGVAVHRLAGRQVAETWVTWDTFGLAEQIGLVLVPISAVGDGEWEGAPEREQVGEPY